MKEKDAKNKIWLIRHAESIANARGVSSDPALIPLTPTGITQANMLVEQFTMTPELIVTSPYIRTMETARPLRSLYPDIPCEEWLVHEFTYISPARCRNTNMADRKPMVEEYWQRADPDYCDGDGAESFNSFLDRVKRAISMLEKREEKFIVIFTHGQFMCAVRWILDQNNGVDKTSDMLAFRKFVNVLAPQNGQKIELYL